MTPRNNGLMWRLVRPVAIACRHPQGRVPDASKKITTEQPLMVR
ncbi:MAG: hypothetical protein ABIQ52_12080 [Vicinamibacterales bacterium]